MASGHLKIKTGTHPVLILATWHHTIESVIMVKAFRGDDADPFLWDLSKCMTWLGTIETFALWGVPKYMPWVGPMEIPALWEVPKYMPWVGDDGGPCPLGSP